MTSISPHQPISFESNEKKMLLTFYKRNWKPVSQYIMTNGGSLQEAEDIFQDALLYLYQQSTSNTLTLKTASIYTYFYAICRNKWLNQLRSKRKLVALSQPPEPLEKAAQELDRVEAHHRYEEQYHLCQAYIKQLSKSQERLLQLILNGYSTREIAKTMGYTEGYTRKKKCKAKKELLEKLYEDERYWKLTG